MASKIQRIHHSPQAESAETVWPIEDAGADSQEHALLSALARGRSSEAWALAGHLTKHFPERGVPWKVLGALLWAQGHVSDALAAMETSVRLLPQDAEARCNLGTSLAKLDRFEEAEARLREAIAIDPRFANAHYRLGMAYSQQTRLRDAVDCLRAGIALRSGYAEGDDAQNYSNLLFILSHLHPADPELLFEEHRRFGESFEDRAEWPRHRNDRNIDRRLRIGFVSGDLREHAVAYFFEPLVAQLGVHPGFELHAYSNSVVVDEVSHRLRKHVQYWHDITALSDERLAEKIVADGIDILIDLSGHTAMNRLAAFARKPAPIQASWIGYPGTTGLYAMDYYLADRRWLPSGRFEAFFTEKLVYLPDRWTFQPHPDAPSVTAPPVLANGHLTFGSFNRADKIGEATVLLWSRLLLDMPAARLIIGGIRLEAQRRALIAAFAAAGIAGERLTFHPPVPMTAHLALYRLVDICLDTTPFNGGTMTLHGLSMGVPTLTVTGDTPMARAGTGILENLGLGAFVARDTADFVHKARHWAQHPDELAVIRSGMRARLQGAPVSQPVLMATQVAGALRHMWKRWCAGLPAESFDSASVAPAVANYCLGMFHVQMQRPEDGLPYLKAALQAQLDTADYWLGYLEALTLAGRTDAARNILAVGRRQGLAGPAVDDFDRRLQSALDSECREQESALNSLVDRGDREAALTLARAITGRFPERGPAWKILGVLLSQRDDPQTTEAMRTTARLLPDDVEAQVNLGLVLAKNGVFDEAEQHLLRALELNPAFAAAHYRLSVTYELQGRFADAEASLRRGLALRTGSVAREDEQCHSNLLFLMAHNPSVQADALFAEHCRYGEYVERRLRTSQPRHVNRRDPQRRLEVGFVSGDLHEHSVANFIAPILRQLQNSPGVAAHVYYTNTLRDEVTRRLQGYCRRWNPVRDLSDSDLAAKISEDGIDVLIDLSGHTRLNRLPTFARKPAPLQVSWLGYPGTTGLHAMDYYLADARWLRPGRFDRLFTEKLVYLPDRWTFEPHAHAPPVGALPSLQTGYLTFGSFHRMEKIDADTLLSWSQLLLALPTARLMLVGIDRERQRDALRQSFAAAGVAGDRLTFHDRCPLNTYLELHHRVDIALDTQPYSGATTTMHSLSMGVPTLTIPGATSQSRACAGILENLELGGFIAADADQLIDRARHWTARLPQLAELRAGLRGRLLHSPGGQPAVITAHLEAALRHMWTRWCAGLPAESFDTDDLNKVSA